MNKSSIGSVVWQDLTVKEPEKLVDFYRQVVGWSAVALPEEGGDFNLLRAEGSEPVAGLCHARGSNSALPPYWLVYVAVRDVETSAERCRALGGQVVDGPRLMGRWKFCVVQDPAGAYIALLEE